MSEQVAPTGGNPVINVFPVNPGASVSYTSFPNTTQFHAPVTKTVSLIGRSGNVVRCHYYIIPEPDKYLRDLYKLRGFVQVSIDTGNPANDFHHNVGVMRNNLEQGLWYRRISQLITMLNMSPSEIYQMIADAAPQEGH